MTLSCGLHLSLVACVELPTWTLRSVLSRRKGLHRQLGHRMPCVPQTVQQHSTLTLGETKVGGSMPEIVRTQVGIDVPVEMLRIRST